jgi:probable F420-dependent oxidoreductase
MSIDLGPTGIWQRELRFHEDRGARLEAAAEVEELGYTALWVPDVGGDVMGVVDELLSATKAIPVATGIVNIWMHEPEAIAAGWADIERRHPGRFTLGLGIGHAPIVDEMLEPGRYRRPLAFMREYLDAIDAADPTVPPDRRMIASLGPRSLELCRQRTGGSCPYLVNPEHTRMAREILGPDRVLAPEQSVLLETDPVRARAKARAFVADYLTLPNYVANLRRLGFEEAELTGTGSDRLADAIVAWGDEQAIADRVAAHRDAGADHVCIQVIDAEGAFPTEAWRRLAPVLLG